MIEDGDGQLSVILSGHPKLRNDLRRPTMEEIGFRTDVFNLDGIAGSQREYIHWLISSYTKSDIAVESILTEEAIGRACKTGGGNLKNPLMNAGIPRQETGNACFHHIKV